MDQISHLENGLTQTCTRHRVWCWFPTSDTLLTLYDDQSDWTLRLEKGQLQAVEVFTPLCLQRMVHLNQVKHFAGSLTGVLFTLMLLVVVNLLLLEALD